jgi:hypothetical protein
LAKPFDEFIHSSTHQQCGQILAGLTITTRAQPNPILLHSLILRRARQHITEGRPRFDTSPERHQRLLQEFLAAASHGDLQGLLSLLSNEVVLYTDGGGKADAALNPIHGANPRGTVLAQCYEKVRAG